MLPPLPSGESSFASLTVLIPAWLPEMRLADIVAELVQNGFGAVVVVNDGTNHECDATLMEVANLERTVLLFHAVNLGKGRALKTGFNFILTSLPWCTGVVTADADGQHSVFDIVRVADALLRCKGPGSVGVASLRIGRPLRSRLGNTLTRYVFGFVTGARLRDTQTGLRGLSRAQLPSLMLLEGERYEYEMGMLAHLCRTGDRPLEVPIEAIYLDGNRSSHFDPIRDSMRIYFVLARFYLSSVLAAGIDFAGFTLAYAATHHLLSSIVIGRLSSLVNFALNRRYVFQNGGSVPGALGRYYLLAIAIAGSSYGLILVATRYLHWNVFAAKIVVDGTLSLISFSMQRTFVFHRKALA